MDRDRLKEVHQTDLTESRVNEDFVDWLKNKGPSWLLAILIGVTGYLGIVRWKQHKQRKTDDAWAAYFDARLPGSKEDVAKEHGDVFAVPELALEEAGVQLLRAVQTGKSLDQSGGEDTPATDTGTPLTAEEREQYLTRAERLFSSLLERDNGSSTWALHALRGLNGQAAVAEARGNPEVAREFYLKGAERVQDLYPALAAQARTRAETVEDVAKDIVFPPPPTPDPVDPPFSPASLDPALAELLR